MLTRKMLFTTAIVGLLGCGTASAQPGPGGWHHGGGGLLEGVTLTSAQQSQVHALMQAEHQNTKSLRQQARAIHEQIETTLLSSGTVTEATLAPLVQQEASLQQQLEAQHLSNEIAIRNLLTSEQLSQAASTHAQMVSLHNQEQALHSSPSQPE